MFRKIQVGMIENMLYRPEYCDTCDRKNVNVQFLTYSSSE